MKTGSRKLCRDVMKENPITCHPTDTCHRVAQLMASNNVGFIPVIDRDRRLIGIVTDRDIVVRGLARGADASTHVDRVMTREVITCKAMDELTKAEKLMAENRKSRIAICDDYGECVGVISLSDIAHADSPQISGQILGKVTQRETQYVS
ncbi:MAG: CBS domain-containing protein [Myxococcales bacterium]